MFKEIHYIYKRVNIFSDAAISALSFMASMLLRAYIDQGSFSLSMPDYLYRYSWIFYLVLFMWPTLLYMNGLYPSNRFHSFKDSAMIIIYSNIQGLIVLLAVLFIFKIQIASRIVLAVFTVIATVSLIIKDALVRLYLNFIRQTSSNLTHVLIIGNADSASYLIKKIEKNKHLGVTTAGILLPPHETHENEICGQKVLGSFKDIEHVLHEYPIDNVIITSYIWDNQEDMQDIIAHCEEEGKEIWIPSRLFHTKISRPDADEFLGIPIFVFRIGPIFSWQLFFKYFLDRVLGFILTLASLPLIITAAIAIKLTSKGPIIYSQKRCSLHGRVFTLYKLRTMFADADQRREELMEKNIMDGPLFKIENDPRITPVGKILRKTSIDEMPQFWNVLKGDMSLIGPRPPLPQEVKEYKGWQRRRLSMRPGITGLWQVSGRSNIKSFDELAELDLIYIDDWSFWLDIKILFKTIYVVLSMKGAK